MRKVALVISACILLLAGCTGGKSSKALEWSTVTYHMTGGIAGFNREITIGADGAYTVVERGKSDARGKLSSAALKQLNERLAAVDWPTLQPRYTDPRIADAILERVKLTGEESALTVEVGTGGAPPEALSDLLAQLKTVGQ